MKNIPVFTDENQRTKVWEQVIARSKGRAEMGAYLITSPNVGRLDKIALNLHLKAIFDLIKGYYQDDGWCGACLDMGLMQMTVRMDAINRCASRYPEQVHQYRTIRDRAEKRHPGPDPKTKFIRTWEGHFKKNLLNEYLGLCSKGNLFCGKSARDF